MYQIKCQCEWSNCPEIYFEEIQTMPTFVLYNMVDDICIDYPNDESFPVYIA